MTKKHETGLQNLDNCIRAITYMIPDLPIGSQERKQALAALIRLEYARDLASKL